jgi:hypothetical protein
LANQNAAFAHSYELLKRAADAKLVEMRFKRNCMIVTRLGPHSASADATEGQHRSAALTIGPFQCDAPLGEIVISLFHD